MILIRNIYYMLSYAFYILNEQGYKNILAEEFDNVPDLCAAILSKGLSMQLKRGLGKEYVLQTDSLSSLKGKIDISESIKTRTILKRQMVCNYDDFSVNSKMNQIIKATIKLLIHYGVSSKKELRKLLVFLEEVEDIDIYNVDWHIQYNRNNQTYRMLISVCYLVVKGLLQTKTDGSTKLMDFLDEQRMCRLYEKFILEYYKKEFSKLTVKAAQIPWGLDDGVGTRLPVMQSDIMLSVGEKVLIIDAKYYEHSTQRQYDKATLHSNNLYQIFAYVKNKDYEFRDKSHEVAGMLLYAKTDEEIHPNNVYQMSGNKISVKTLDLNCDFNMIKEQLDSIAFEHFGEQIKVK